MVQAFEVPVTGPGRLWQMSCPRPQDFGDLAALGITRIVSMLAQDEARALHMDVESALCAEQGIDFTEYPIQDFGLPDLPRFVGFVSALTGMLDAGESIAVHCRAGIGRSGMVSSCVLVAQGQTSTQAIETVSTARGIRIPDTVQQADFVSLFADSLTNI